MVHSLGYSGLFSVLRICYLFTASDLFSMMLSSTTCGLLLQSKIGLEQYPPSSLSDKIHRIPLAVLWVWSNMLLFNISNQSQQGAVEEDRKNKPWRPLPSGRLTLGEALKWKQLLTIATVSLSVAIGGLGPCLMLQVFTFLYNDLKGSDNWIPRNPLNAAGYLCFIVGAMQVARGSQSLTLSIQELKWLFWTFTLISSSVHAQDIYDRDGDQERGRKTVPLVFGDTAARYSVALGVGLGSVLSPFYWHSSAISLLPLLTLGLYIIVRLVRNAEKCPAYDKMTFMYWNIWVIVALVLPLWI